MPKKRERNTPSAVGGQAYREAHGLVGTVIHWTPEERDRARQAAAALGYGSLQQFCREVLVKRAEKALKKNSENSSSS